MRRAGHGTAWGLALLTLVLLPPQVAWARPIVVGTVSQEPSNVARNFLPLAAYLAKALQAEGIDRGEVAVGGSMERMAALIRDGAVDLYIDSPFPSLVVRQLSRSQFLLRRWKKGLAEYRSLIFTRADAAIRRLEDLQGKRIALEEPYSTTGYLLPKAALVEKGLKLAPKTDHGVPVGTDEVGSLFTYDDQSTVVWVLRGKTDAGAIDQQGYELYAKASLHHLSVLYESPWLPRQIVSIRPDLPPALIARIRALLLAMDKSGDGRRALLEFQRTTRFDELPEASLAPLLRLQPLIDAEIGPR